MRRAFAVVFLSLLLAGAARAVTIEAEFRGLWTFINVPGGSPQRPFVADFTFTDGQMTAGFFSVDMEDGAVPFGSDLRGLALMAPVRFSFGEANYVSLPGDGYHRFFVTDTDGFWQWGSCGTACAFMVTQDVQVFEHSPAPTAGSLGGLIIFLKQRIWK